MAKSLEELRADLARDVGMFHTGLATGGAMAQIGDTDGLDHFDEADALNGAMCYIRWADDLPPQGDWRWITDYVIHTITLEYNLTAGIAIGDIYEVYLAPLTLEQWNKAINAAILAAWPEVWRREQTQIELTGVDTYALPADVEDVLSVQIVPIGVYRNWPAQIVPPRQWQVEGTPGTDLYLRLLRPLSGLGRMMRVYYQGRYVELAEDEETDLDYSYIMAGAKAVLYEELAGEARGQADAGRYLQLMTHWQGLAEARKAELQARLLGVVGPVEGRKKQRRK